MPFYHATWVESLKEIQREGLRPVPIERKNYPDAPQGVYLACDPLVAISFLIEALIERSDLRSSVSPADDLARVRILVIDDARVDRSKLKIDPVIEKPEIAYLYSGTIDVSGSVVLDVSQVQDAFRVS